MPWEQLQAIREIQRQEAREAAKQPPAACPVCGDVLDVHPDGWRNCPMGHYTWTG